MTSQSSESVSQSSPETSARATTRTVYQRKVRVTMTRAEAELARRLFLRAATDPYAAETMAPEMNPSTFEQRAKRLWKKTDRRIELRDKAMAAKQPGQYKTDDTEDEVDVPLLGL